jgi:hypothetical protein
LEHVTFGGCSVNRSEAVQLSAWSVIGILLCIPKSTLFRFEYKSEISPSGRKLYLEASNIDIFMQKLSYIFMDSKPNSDISYMTYVCGFLKVCVKGKSSWSRGIPSLTGSTVAKKLINPMA